MAGWWCWRAALVLAAWPLLAEGQQADTALDMDDECSAEAAAAGECAVSVLQRRGQVASQGKDDKVSAWATTTGTAPTEGDDESRRRRRRRRRRTTTTTTTTTASEDDEDDEASDGAADCDEGDNSTEGCTEAAPTATTTPAPTEAAAYATCGGRDYTGPTTCVKGYMCSHMTPYYAQCVEAKPKDWDTYVGSKALNESSQAEPVTFYMYRASATNNYALANVNTADLAGVMWYIHNEVVSCVYNDCMQVRRFGIDRIRRYKVTYRPTQPLLDAGMHFGIRYAYDQGACTGPWVCETQFAKYGYFVGCNSLQSGFPFPDWPIYYNGTWFSLPGSCSAKVHDRQTMECREDQPGGDCGLDAPTGKGTCTYKSEDAGFILINDLVGMTNYTAFKEMGGEEFNKTLDEGVNETFWDNLNSTEANLERVQAANDLFKQKYPNMPGDEELPTPPCDFDKKKFFSDGLPTELNRFSKL